MKHTIDCLFIGHNEMMFQDYEKNIEQIGVTSGAYRDLNLNFIRYQDRSYPISEIFNLFYYDDQLRGNSHKPLMMGDTFSAAISYLGTYLDRRGYSFDFVNSFQYEKEELAEKLKQENILVIGIITTYYVFALPIREIMEFIKTYNKTAKVIIGGPFVFTQVRTQEAAVINYLFESIGADLYVCSSQGEATLVNILNALKNDLPLDRVNNIYYKSGSEYVATPFLTENNKLSKNRVDWDLFSSKAGEYINVRTAISCPFSCSFCGFPQHAGTYQTTPVEEIEKELEQIARIPSLKGVSFIDDTFNVPPRRFKDILRMMIRKKYTFEWIANFRCQYADRETVELMKACNCRGVFLGIESGNNQILKNMNKAASLEKHLKGVALLKEYGIMTFGSFIIGFPGETTETVQDTVKFIEESGLDFFRAHLWYFEPITPIWREREKYDLRGESFEWSHSTMESKTASDIIDNIFLSAKNAIWIPQYNFDFDQLWHLMHRGMNMERIKEFLKSFNSDIKEKLLNSSCSNAGPGVIRRLKKACRGSGSPGDPGDEEMLPLEDYGVAFNF